MDIAALEDLQFVCPRCANDTAAKFYGPCAACCEELRATQGRAAREAEVVDYEPKMNVVPNQIATKD